MSDDNDNIFQLHSGGKDQVKKDKLPEHHYMITDIIDQVWYAFGFLIFTSHHVAVMQDFKGAGAIPILVIPLDRVKAAELDEEDDTAELPF